jgi:TldD protein
MIRLSDRMLSDILRKSLSQGGEYADVFVENRPHSSIQLEDENIEKVIFGVEAGIGIRVIHGDRTAFAYGNEFSEKSLFGLAETVSRASPENRNGQKDCPCNSRRQNSKDGQQ